MILGVFSVFHVFWMILRVFSVFNVFFSIFNVFLRQVRPSNYHLF